MDVRLIKAAVIGDGCLNIRERYRNARFLCTHSIKQKDYLLWKRDLLAAAGLQTAYGEFWNTSNPHTGKRNLFCRIESNVSPILTTLHDQLYPKSDGFKPGVLDDLEAIHLAIIFMDDGTKQVNKKADGVAVVPYISSFRIALQSHGFGGAHQFVDWLNAKFGVHSSIFKQAGQPVVAIYRNRDKEMFRETVQPFIHSTMTYKIDGSVHAHRERLSERASLRTETMRQSDLAGNEPREGASKNLPASE